MMITIQTTPEDLTKLRFAYRPLLEIAFSLRVLGNPALHGKYWRWVEDAQRALDGVELPFLADLITPDSTYIPHFLTPTPTSNGGSIEDDLEDLLATSDEVIQKYVLWFIESDGDSEIRRYFVAHPREAMRRLVEETRLYWDRTMAQHWSQMVSVLEGDILYRGRLLALDGPGVLLEDLHPTISFRQHQIQIQPMSRLFSNVDLNLRGDGIQLIPSIFSDVRRIQIVPEWRPRLTIPVRGRGLWGQKPRTHSLELALGTGKARVLQGLQMTASTGELAHRLGVSSGAVSQLLNRLARAGLVEPHRSGKRVYYRLTKRGEELIALFERIY
jgi:DNA-binding transcriptional ArsR family regulator